MDLPPSNNPNHPSNQLHDAAYPMSDYQPQNITPPQGPPTLQSPPSASPVNHNTAPSPSAKYAEIATPALALTSGQASSSWHAPGPSHLDTTLDPPPSYEQSQSQTQSRPSTSNQASTSNLSTAPPRNPIPSPNSPTTPSVISSSAPTPPTAAYHPARPSTASRPSNYPPAPSTATSTTAAPSPQPGPLYGAMPAMGYHKPDALATQSRLKRLRRRSCYITLLLIGVFVLAIFVGLMIGFRDKLDDSKKEQGQKGSPQMLGYEPSPTTRVSYPSPYDNSADGDFLPLFKIADDDSD